MKLPLLLSALVLLSLMINAPRAIAGPGLSYLTYDPNTRECFVFTGGNEHVSYSLKDPRKWLQFAMSGFNPKIETPHGTCDFSNGYYNSCCAQIGMRLLSIDEIKERVVLVTDHRPKVVPPSLTESTTTAQRPATQPKITVQKEDDLLAPWKRERRMRLIVFSVLAVILTALVALGLRALIRHRQRKQIAIQLVIAVVANVGGFFAGVKAGGYTFNAVCSSFHNHDSIGPVLIASLPALAALIGGWALTVFVLTWIMQLILKSWERSRKEK